MIPRGIEPDVIIYNAAINASVKGMRWKKALDLLQEMPDSGIQPNDLLQAMSDRFFEPDIISFSSAISAYEKGK